MNPLHPIPLNGHTNVYLLQNRWVEAVIYPALGRVGQFQFRGEPNVLRFDDALAAAAAGPVPEPPPGWRNFGGDWLWPVSQAHWPAHFGAHWPPPWFLDGPPWTARGWINHDQSQSVLLEIEIGAPLHIRVHRKFTLPADSTTLVIRQRIERIAPSDVPVTLWNISQIAAAERIALAVETNSAFVGGYRVLDFAPPADGILNTQDPLVLVAHVQQAGEIKIGSDSPRGWIAAQRGDTVLLEGASGAPEASAFPDGGCRTELYSNSGLGYSEIETLSEERALQPGEHLENTLTMALHRMPAELDDASFAARLRALAGDPPPAAP